MEDTEFLVRLWRSGRRSRYVPDSVALAQVQPERMRKAYHRQWQRRNARWSAKMRLDECFDGAGRLLPGGVDGPTLFGVPTYLYRQLIATSMRWVGAAAILQRSRAFLYEKQLCQQSSYIGARMKDPSAPPYSFSAEISILLPALRRKAQRWLFSHP